HGSAEHHWHLELCRVCRSLFQGFLNPLPLSAIDVLNLGRLLDLFQAIEDYERQLCKCALSRGQSQTHCNFLRIYQLGVHMDELDNSLAVQRRAREITPFMGDFKELNIAIPDMACSAVITHFAQWWNVEGSGIEKIRLIDQQNWELDEVRGLLIFVDLS
ncbi:hypothetical protein BKA93DRAFT_731923, partial [Sparassis latifolia]